MPLHGENPAETTIQRLAAPAVIVGKLLTLAIMLALFSAYCAQAAEKVVCAPPTECIASDPDDVFCIIMPMET